MCKTTIILGIGNIGQEYLKTRHNIGFDVVDAIVSKFGLNSTKELKNSTLHEVTILENRVLCIKPKTYVNLSGLALSEVLENYSLDRESLLVVVDDFHLPLGRLRFRKRGSSGGHNGMKSLISVVGEDFHRLRFGIGPLPEGVEITEFVLGRFSSDEHDLYNESLIRAVDGIKSYIQDGMENTMNRFNS